MPIDLFCRHHVSCVFCGHRETVRKSAEKGWLVWFAGHPFAYFSRWYPTVFGPICPPCRELHTVVDILPGIIADFALRPGHAAYLISARN